MTDDELLDAIIRDPSNDPFVYILFDFSPPASLMEEYKRYDTGNLTYKFFPPDYLGSEKDYKIIIPESHHVDEYADGAYYGDPHEYIAALQSLPSDSESYIMIPPGKASVAIEFTIRCFLLCKRDNPFNNGFRYYDLQPDDEFWRSVNDRTPPEEIDIAFDALLSRRISEHLAAVKRESVQDFIHDHSAPHSDHSTPEPDPTTEPDS